MWSWLLTFLLEDEVSLKRGPAHRALIDEMEAMSTYAQMSAREENGIFRLSQADDTFLLGRVIHPKHFLSNKKVTTRFDKLADGSGTRGPGGRGGLGGA